MNDLRVADSNPHRIALEVHMAPNVSATRDGARHASPPLAVLAVVHAAVFMASLAVTVFLTRGDHFPSPFAASAASLDFFSRHSLAVRWSAFLQLGAAVPLGLFTATAASRLQFLGVRAAGVHIAFFGGIGASVFLALSAAVQWALSWPDVLESQAIAHALHLTAFATGGPAHLLTLGLLLAGVSVTGGMHRLLPTFMMASGLVLAAIAELSWLSLVVPPASYLLPLARFPAFAWLIAAGALLPRGRRHGRELSPHPDAAASIPGFPAKEGAR
jgi:hypothetical protein